MKKETCTACFLECERSSGMKPYPCSDELREWAEKHRDDPAGFVYEEVRHKRESASN